MSGRFDGAEIGVLADMLAEAAAAEIMPRFRNLAASDIRQKTSVADLVTDADVAAERLLTKQLLARYPGALIVGEEACSENPGILDGLAGAPLAFVLDPVDGTYNFAAGVPLFGVMLAVVVNGETVAGIIHDPVGKDSLLAERGSGSFIRAAGGEMTPTRVAQSRPMNEMTGGLSWQYLQEPARSTAARNMAKCLSHFGYRAAAAEYRLLATGFGHFVAFAKLMPWDHLAGVLIHREAGGYSARIDGSDYRPGDTTGVLLAAPDRDSWQEIRSAIFEIGPD